MTRKTALCILVTGLLLMATGNGCASQLGPAGQPFPAADFTAEDMNGQMVKLSDYGGKVVVLNFWAIWCPPCRTEMPEFEAVYREYREQGVVILAVNVYESSADIIAFAQELGLTFPILRDSRHEALMAHNIQVLPTTLFIDREGQVQLRQLGAMRKSVITQQIERLLE